MTVPAGCTVKWNCAGIFASTGGATGKNVTRNAGGVGGVGGDGSGGPGGAGAGGGAGDGGGTGCDSCTFTVASAMTSPEVARTVAPDVTSQSTSPCPV
jgi:hypothetical protein